MFSKILFEIAYNGLLPPGEFSFSGNLSETWIRWKQKLNLYIEAGNSLRQKEDSRLVSLLLTCIGDRGIEIYNTFTFDKEEGKKSFKIVIQKFDCHFLPKKNLTFLRHQFFSRIQRTSESIDDYVTDLRNMFRDCEFGTLAEGLIKDRLVCGILNVNIKERLPREADLNLDRALEICHAAEISSKQMKALESANVETTGVLHTLKQNRPTLHSRVMQSGQMWSKDRTSQDRSSNGGKYRQYNQGRPSNKSKFSSHGGTPFGKCGTKHSFRNCPAYGRKCFKCSKLGRFSKTCKKGSSQINSLSEATATLARMSVNINRSCLTTEPTDNVFVGGINLDVNDVNKPMYGSDTNDSKEWRVTLQAEG